MSEDQTLRCQALTRSGSQCRNRPANGASYCRLHLPAERTNSSNNGAAEHAPSSSSESLSRLDMLLAALEEEIRAQPAPDDRPAAMGDLIALIRNTLDRWTPELLRNTLDFLRQNINSDYLDPDFWRGLAMILLYQLDANTDLVKRRLRGTYELDPFGLDYELLELVKPFMRFMYYRYWRVEMTGVEHVPESGRALLVANHSGVLPWDGAMIATGIMELHPSARLVRNLHLTWFSQLPFIAPLLSRFGQVQALPDNAERLLNNDELVCVFPEGLKGVGKLYQDRYKLARFGRGGFVKIALRTGAPMIPVAVVGAEEIHPMLANAEPIAKILGFPFFPLTPTWPWLGPLGFIPLPSKWYIQIGEPIPTAQYGPEGAEDPLLVSQLTNRVRDTIQDMLLKKLEERSGVFLGE